MDGHLSISEAVCFSPVCLLHKVVLLEFQFGVEMQVVYRLSNGCLRHKTTNIKEVWWTLGGTEVFRG